MMQKMKAFKQKSLSCLFVFMLLVGVWLCWPLGGAAEVITSPENDGPAGYVYVAGNPDLYPIEYYDSGAKCYKGLVPDLLADISETTGLSFVYLSGGTQNRQAELVNNGQAELVTAYTQESFDTGSLVAQLPLTNVSANGERIEVYIGFTALASAEVQEKVTDAFAQIPESDKTESVIDYAANRPPATDHRVRLWILASLMFVSLSVLAVVLVQQRRQNNLAQLAKQTDSLTGLGNLEAYRFCFSELMDSEVKNLYYLAYLSWHESKARKMLHDEELLTLQKQVAQQLSEQLMAGESVFRIADGIFVVLYQSSNHHVAAERAEAMVLSLRDVLPALQNGYEDLFTAGVCALEEYPECRAESALCHAEQGYSYAVAQGLPYAFSTGAIVSANSNHDKLRRDLRKALDNQEFLIYLQYIVNAQTEAICGAEVLSRWDHPELGLLTPGRYVELMKQTDTVAQHDYFIFEKVCALLEQWQGSDYDALFLTCNFTRISVSKRDFVEKIKAISDRYQFDRHKLYIEITEDSLLEDDSQVSGNLNACKAMGFCVAIDDMGSGFSSISDLCSNEIDVVKIERDIVVNGVTEKGRKLLDAMISLVHSMDARVICEGVETEEQKKMISMTDCDMIQGFYYARVLPYRDAMQYLKSSAYEKPDGR